MSIHRSFKSANSLQKHRNVLSRRERIEKLASLKKWDEGDNSIFGLPKVRNIKLKSKKKVKAEAVEEGAATEGEAAPGEAAAPAAEEKKKE
jgi:small basic protein (TIGR04137 family)